jgi:hypothetical protein
MESVIAILIIIVFGMINIFVMLIIIINYYLNRKLRFLLSLFAIMFIVGSCRGQG